MDSIFSQREIFVWKVVGENSSLSSSKRDERLEGERESKRERESLDRLVNNRGQKTNPRTDWIEGGVEELDDWRIDDSRLRLRRRVVKGSPGIIPFSPDRCLDPGLCDESDKSGIIRCFASDWPL